MFGDNFMGGVQISPNLKRTREMIDTGGNVINPETKEIIRKNEPDYTPTKDEIEAQINAKPGETGRVVDMPVEGSVAVNIQGLTIQQQIDQAEKHLASLKLQKKEEIARRRAELAELEASE